jgi:hypothetical protein
VFKFVQRHVGNRGDNGLDGASNGHGRSLQQAHIALVPDRIKTRSSSGSCGCGRWRVATARRYSRCRHSCAAGKWFKKKFQQIRVISAVRPSLPVYPLVARALEKLVHRLDYIWTTGTEESGCDYRCISSHRGRCKDCLRGCSKLERGPMTNHKPHVLSWQSLLH